MTEESTSSQFDAASADSTKSIESSSPSDFTTGPIHTHLIRLTGYMLLGFVSIMTASLMETVYIGMIGTNELAAVSFTFPLVMILQGVAMGLSVGASSIVARTMGTGDREKVRRLITHCFILVMVLILLFTSIAYANLEFFFELLGAQPHILPLIIRYMEIWLLGLPFFTVALVGSTLMRAAGDAVTPGYLMTVGSALHVIIAPFFIFGIGPVPEMGLEGAAIGFVLARTVSFCLYSYFIGYRDKLLIASLTGLWSSTRDILHVGLPAIASNLIGPVSMGIITRLLAAHGAEVVAGYGVASKIESMAVMLIIALGMSIAPFVGQNWGADKYQRVRDALSLSYRLSLLWGLFAFVMMVLFGEILVSLINVDPLVVQSATTYLYIVPLSMGCMGIMMISTQSFNALGKPMPPLVISINQTLLVYVPLAILGDYLWGYTGIFIATVVTSILMSILSWYWLNSVVKSRIETAQ
ncbi:MAG: MATE family efflux transporter [Pseudomonadales bacterium]|jgi:putative MATE family efflux protein|nr:MATE family efflux transporter [Pseudomonadales bacterium]MDP7594855.1 MATE family efflux transporter [Pseudomonadales bacterium]HJN50233.1 MATE family efflux transporter [Pseudomonadales bacterium]|tara:strand:+ start:1445 stop:2851 length:1407 start_codon:yes stop_codon:yes gene_type:complete